ncbi:hypothetical protein [Facklamia sp. P9177]|uniref:hypothetical protein n=1 Tax=Facklamia sp. P9177 TaxID=3421945 RepID=UPI003D170444
MTTKLEALEKKIEKAKQELELEREKLSVKFGKIIVDNFDKKEFKNQTEFKEWYLAKIEEEQTKISDHKFDINESELEGNMF